MKIATLLFTYNRSYHTEQALSALKENTALPQKLIVFQDGRKRLLGHLHSTHKHIFPLLPPDTGSHYVALADQEIF